MLNIYMKRGYFSGNKYLTWNILSNGDSDYKFTLNILVNVYIAFQRSCVYTGKLFRKDFLIPA